MQQAQKSLTAQSPLKNSRAAISFHPSPGFDFKILDQASPKRQSTEQLIQRGFAARYQAMVEVTMPYLICLTKHNNVAALGFRSGKQTLFLEQYLSVPVEQVAHFQHREVLRENIAEIGHLYSNCSKFTVPLFLLTALTLKELGFQHLVFAGNERVIQLVNTVGVSMVHLANASEEQLQTTDNHWGSYYNTNPRVVTVSLEETRKVIFHNPIFEPYLSEFLTIIQDSCELFKLQTNQLI